MTIGKDDVNTIAGGGGDVRTSNGDKVGAIGQVYLDDESGQPSWVTVKTGLFGTQESFVPLSRADLDGADLVVPYDKETIKGAPRVDTDVSLTPQEEKRLYSYYFTARTVDSGEDRGDRRGQEDLDRDSRSQDRSRDGRLDDDDQSRDTDQNDDRPGDNVGTTRLRRYVVTEKVVPVSREELPVDDTDRP